MAPRKSSASDGDSTPPEAVAVEAEAPAGPPAVMLPLVVARQDLADWADAHCRNSPVSRDTDTYNQITALVRQIDTALGRLQAKGAT